MLNARTRAQLEGVLPKSLSASDVRQTFLSAGSGDFPVPGFRVKQSALVREVGKLRNRQARKPALQFGQHALDTTTLTGGRMPPSLARWKRAATVATAILAASEYGFQPHISASVVVISSCASGR